MRDDASHSDILFQTSDATWQAYNTYGGNSLYAAPRRPPDARAYKVSLQPAVRRTRAPTAAHSFFFYAEYPMIRWLEANGYDVSYFTGRRHRPPRRS